MKLVAKLVGLEDTDYLALISELNQQLLSLTGDTGESSFSTELLDPSQEAIIVVFDNNLPVGTGSIRYVGENTCEIKRMFSKKSGVGKFIISELEKIAVNYGYSEVVLSTRRINEKAVNFYRMKQYKEIDTYGKYIGVPRSICMGKSLSP